MNRAALRIAAAALSLLLAAPEPPAYLVRAASNATEITWNLATSAPNVVAGRVTYYVDTGSAIDVTGNQFADAVRGAVQSWEDVDGSAIAFTEDSGRSSSSKSSADKINRFGFTPGVLSPFTFASAYTATANNRIVDVDVVFNPEMDWSVQFPGSDEAADVEGVAVHEWGHGLGLDHVPLSRSTMYWSASYGAVSLRTPEADDAAAVIHAYPDAEAGTAFATLSGDVDVAGAPDDRGVQVTAVDFLTGFPAVSTLSATDGSWVLHGLPPGVYRLLAGPIGTGQKEMGVYSDYWDGAVTDFLPAVRGQDGAADGSTGVLAVVAGDSLPDLDFALSGADGSGEPNDAFSSAKALDVGDSVGGRVSTSNDHDWFTFTGNAGQTVSVYLHARQIGSDLDPRLYLRNAARTQIAISQDISLAYTGAAGADLDCAIVDFELPSTGTYYLELEPESSVDLDRPEDFFYVLTLLAGGGTPSPFTSTLVANPSLVDADGASAATLTFEPRSLTGGLSGTGLDVSFTLGADGNADGALSGVSDEGDGTYVATLTAPSSGGSDLVEARVDGAVVASALVTFVGVADPSTSDLAAVPRRLRPDGSSTSVLRFTPRDSEGVALGAGRTVAFSLDGDFDASLGTTVDEGDGSYTVVATAGTAMEEPGILVTTDGEGLGSALHPLAVGFPVEEVREEVLADLDDLLSGGFLPAKSEAKVRKARDLLDIAAGDPATLVKAVGKAVKQMEAAAKKGAPTADLAAECAEACRQLAVDAVADAGPAADEEKEQKALAKAELLVDAGDLLLDGARPSKACAKYAGALKQTAKILP